MATVIWVNIGSGNGLLPDGMEQLPEPMLTDHQLSPVTFILGQFHEKCLNHQSLKSFLKITSKISFKLSRGQWVNEWGISSSGTSAGFCDYPSHFTCTADWHTTSPPSCVIQHIAVTDKTTAETADDNDTATSGQQHTPWGNIIYV